MMRGFAGSGGHLKDYVCDVASLGLDAAHDVSVVIDELRRNPGIDSQRIIIAGKSMGGGNT
jgi:dipeptidyl aminopeptidase/acylaminoacyl peptidase